MPTKPLGSAAVVDQRNDTFLIDQEGSSVMHDEDFQILGRVERALTAGAALKRWFDTTESINGFAERFNVVREFNPSDASFGFYDTVDLVDGGRMPVMGTVDDSVFDRPKQAGSTLVRDELR